MAVDLKIKSNSKQVSKKFKKFQLNSKLINKTKKITTINIAIPRPISSTYSLSIISFKNGFTLGNIINVKM